MGKRERHEVPEEERLVALCLRGHNRSWRQLIERFQAPVYRLCYRMLRDQSEAEDASQETFLKVYRRLETFRQGSPFLPWLLRVAYNVCLRRLEKRVPLLLDSPPEEVAGKEVGPEEALAQGQRRQMVEEAIFRLPPAYRAVITLRHLEGLDYQEIAQVLELPLGTVKTNLFRARERLRQTLQPQEQAL